MLQDPSTPGPRARVLAATVLAVTFVAIAPLRLGARPAIAPADSSSSMRVHEPSTAAVVPSAPVAVATAQRQSTSSGASHQEDVNYVFMTGDSTTMSGDSRDIRRVRSLRNGGEDLLWFRRNGREYVVRDPAVLKGMKEIWAPVSRLGAEQGELGAKQGELGAHQGQLGAQQGAIGAQQGALGARQGTLGAEQGRLALRELRMTEAERRQIEQKRRAIDDQMRDLDREMRILDDKMREFEEPMDKLAAEMEALGAEMEHLGREMEQASTKAEAEMLALINRAIAGGLAQEVR